MHTLSGKSVQIEELHASLAELQATTEREMNAANTALEQSMAETLKAEKEVSGLQRELHDSSVQVGRSRRCFPRKERNASSKEISYQWRSRGLRARGTGAVAGGRGIKEDGPDAGKIGWLPEGS